MFTPVASIVPWLYTWIVKLIKPSTPMLETSAVLTTLTSGSWTLIVSLAFTEVEFSLQYTVTLLVNSPKRVVWATTWTVTFLPLTISGIVHVEFALTNVKPSGKTSVITTFVALDGPLLITVIVYVTLSPTAKLSSSETLTTTKLTIGVIFTVLLPWTTVVFSPQVTLTVLVQLPAVTALRIILTFTDSPEFKLEIVQVLFSPSTNSNPSGTISVILIFVALDGPLLVTVIVKLTVPPTDTISTLDCLMTIKLTTGVITIPSVVFSTPRGFSLQFTLTVFTNVPLVTARAVILTVTFPPFSIDGIIHVEFPLTSTKPLGKVSFITTLVATDGPLLNTVIVKLTKSPTPIL